MNKRINEIQSEIKNLNEELTTLLLAEINSTENNIIQRFEMISDISTYKISDNIEEPFVEYAEIFAKQLGEPLHSCIFDELHSQDRSRHETVYINEIAEDLWYNANECKHSPEETPDVLVPIIYDRSTKKRLMFQFYYYLNTLKNGHTKTK